MANIIDSVGNGGANAIHDVVLVQLMLKTLKNSQHASYFAQPYTSAYSAETARALSAFQGDRMGAGKPSTEIAGLVKPGSATWQALSTAFTAAATQYPDARATKGVGLAYVPMPPSRLGESLAAIRGTQNLQPDFRQKVVQLVQSFYQQSEIVFSLVPRTGGWRPFAGQDKLVSDASFGESIHQYGYAVDMIVANFSWIGPDSQLRKSAVQLDGLDRRLVIQLYAARNAIATTLKLYPTTLEGDMAHLQAFVDDPLDSVSSLMALMHAVGPKAMNWKPRYRTPTDYLCDLGLGGDSYFVGTASDIWNQDPTHRISADDLAKALQAKKKRDAKFSSSAFLGRPGPAQPDPVAASDITPADITVVQKMLRAEVDAAAANWKLWKPVNYPNGDRRPPNPVKRPRR